MTERDSSPPEPEDKPEDAEAKPAAEPEPEPEPDAFEKSRASWGFPGFAREFPNDPELAVLVAAFAAGDYATVRAGAPALASKTTDDRVKAAATLLRSRIEPDPTSRVFFALTAALLVFLMTWWATHDGPQSHGPPPPKPPPTVEFVK
jgi:hypothetical protein